VLTVQDTIGITKEFMPFVFDRFRQADGSLTREHGAVWARHRAKLTELHGGSLSAASDGAEKGATFRLTLPRLDAARRRTRNPPPAVPMRRHVWRKFVCWVDDDSDALDVIAEGCARRVRG
jgi:hypothetical protein